MILVARPGIAPQQIDDFPAGCERSCKGAFHIRSGTLTVTDGEWEHIKSKHEEVAQYLSVVSEPAPAPKVPEIPTFAPSFDRPKPRKERRRSRSESLPDSD